MRSSPAVSQLPAEKTIPASSRARPERRLRLPSSRLLEQRRLRLPSFRLRQQPARHPGAWSGWHDLRRALKLSAEWQASGLRRYSRPERSRWPTTVCRQASSLRAVLQKTRCPAIHGSVPCLSPMLIHQPVTLFPRIATRKSPARNSAPPPPNHRPAPFRSRQPTDSPAPRDAYDVAGRMCHRRQSLRSGRLDRGASNPQAPAA